MIYVVVYYFIIYIFYRRRGSGASLVLLYIPVPKNQTVLVRVPRTITATDMEIALFALAMARARTSKADGMSTYCTVVRVCEGVRRTVRVNPRRDHKIIIIIKYSNDSHNESWPSAKGLQRSPSAASPSSSRPPHKARSARNLPPTHYNVYL